MIYWQAERTLESILLNLVCQNCLKYSQGKNLRKEQKGGRAGFVRLFVYYNTGWRFFHHFRDETKTPFKIALLFILHSSERCFFFNTWSHWFMACKIPILPSIVFRKTHKNYVTTSKYVIRFSFYFIVLFSLIIFLSRTLIVKLIWIFIFELLFV